MAAVPKGWAARVQAATKEIKKSETIKDAPSKAPAKKKG